MDENTETVLIVIALAVLIVVPCTIVYIQLYEIYPEETDSKDSVVGCYFEYRVAGNYDEDTFYKGTQRLTVISQDENRYQVRTETNVNLVSDDGTVPYEDNGTATYWVAKRDLAALGDYNGDLLVHTYWGDKILKSYISVENGKTTISYVGMGDAVMERVFSDGDELMILMLQKSDYINSEPSGRLETYSMKYEFTGTSVKSGETTALSGSALMKVADSTSTCYRIYEELSGNIDGTEEYDFKGTKWIMASEDLLDLGSKIDNVNISAYIGDLNVDVYQKITKESIHTYYIYREQLVIDMKTVGVTDDSSYSETGVLKMLNVDGKNLSTKYEFDEFVDRMV